MAAKVVLFIVSSVLVQNAFSQCLNSIGAAAYPGLINNGLGISNLGINSLGLYGNNVLGLGYNGIIPDLVGYPNLGNIGSSGPLPVSTISPIGPSGLAVASENEIAGTLLASGTLPFLSAVAFEGALPTAGSGVATCGCGNGAVGIVNDGFPAPFPTALPGYATIGTGIGGMYY